jgi:hypothetical protein
LKLYFSLGLSCKLIWDTSAKSNSRDRFRTHADFNQRRCNNNTHHNVQLDIDNLESEVIKNNVTKNRLDGNLEFGIIHEKKRSSFKGVIFFEESITNYSVVGDRKHRAQQIGLKVGIRKNRIKAD